jgi:hypothetical protein
MIIGITVFIFAIITLLASCLKTFKQKLYKTDYKQLETDIKEAEENESN